MQSCMGLHIYLHAPVTFFSALRTLHTRNFYLSMKTKKPVSVKDNAANQQNKNKGTDGTNRQYDQAQGNRSKQLTEKKGK